jgi:hypothetical protein
VRGANGVELSSQVSDIDLNGVVAGRMLIAPDQTSAQPAEWARFLGSQAAPSAPRPLGLTMVS